jgi:hypothetical protein
MEFCWEAKTGLTGRLASFFAATTMIIPCPILVGSPKERPLTDQRCTRGSREEQVGQQMTHFGGGQRDKGSAGCRLLLSRSSQLALDRDADKKGIGEQHERNMAIPAEVAAHFILIESQCFARLQVLFDAPACANGLHHGGQRSLGWSPDEEVSQLVGVV